MITDKLLRSKLIEFEVNQSQYYGIDGNHNIKITNITLMFTEGTVVIENPIELIVDDVSIDLTEDNISLLNEFKKLEIESIIVNDGKNIIIGFNKKNKIIISLEDEKFIGPEAACFHLNSGEIIVFN